MAEIITLGNILDLIDENRESDEIVKVMENGTTREEFRARVCSPFWKPFEDRIVENIQAEDDELKIWLY